MLSHADDDEAWEGERGFVHERVDARLKALGLDGQGDVYACGPPPMIDALQPVLFMNGFEPERIFFDQFTPRPRASSVPDMIRAPATTRPNPRQTAREGS